VVKPKGRRFRVLAFFPICDSGCFRELDVTIPRRRFYLLDVSKIRLAEVGEESISAILGVGQVISTMSKVSQLSKILSQCCRKTCVNKVGVTLISRRVLYYFPMCLVNQSPWRKIVDYRHSKKVESSLVLSC